MLSRLHRKDHPLAAVTRTLRIRENKINILKTLDMYNPAKDYFHPLHPRNRPKSRFNHLGTITGRMSGKTYMAQSMLSHMLGSTSSNKLTAGTCIHDELIADYSKLEQLMAASMERCIASNTAKDMMLSPKLTIEKPTGFVVSSGFSPVLRNPQDMVILSGSDI